MEDLLDKIEISMDENDPRIKTLDLMRKVIRTIPTEQGQKYALSRFLNDPQYGFSDIENFRYKEELGDAKDLWSVKHQEDYTPPNIEKAEEKRDAEAFWNWDSNKHWTKRGTDELKRRAEDAGYSDYKAYLKEVGDIQTRKDREKIYDEEAMPGTKLLYPRMTEKVLQGKDIEGKDAFLDIGEQGLYALNPADRLLGGATKLAKWGGAVANPLAMETADALAYRGEDTDRANFSPIDVIVGAGINRGMDKLTTPMLKNLSRDSKNYIDSKAFARDRQALDKLKIMADEAEKSGNVELSNILNKKTLDKLTEIVEKGKPKEKIKDSFTNRYIRQLAEKDLANDAASFVSNKTGDLLSEDPKRTKRLLRSAVGPGGVMAMPLINDVVDAYYESDEKNKEKKKIDDLIYGLQGGR